MSGYLLFYSNYCPHSKDFIHFLESTGQSIYFTKICIDKIKGKRPPIVAKFGIREVPSIIIDNKLLAGLSAFTWLESKVGDPKSGNPKFNDPMQTRMNKTENHINPSTANRDNDEAVNPYYGHNISNSIADNCVGINDDTSIYSIQENGDLIDSSKFNTKGVQLQQAPITGNMDIENFTNQQNNIPVKRDKLKQNQLDNRYHQLQRQRELDVPVQTQRQ